MPQGPESRAERVLRQKRESQRRVRAASIPRTLWQSAQQRARRLGTTFTITVEDVRRVWPSDGKCPVLGMSLQRQPRAPGPQSPTLDRLNNAWGYEPGNIAVISHRANTLKSVGTAEEIASLLRWMDLNGLA